MESDTDHYKLKDKNNWMYLRFNTIHELDPQFYENYLYGGLFLSIIKDDIEAGADIYEKGLKRYPDDYQLNYNAGFNYYFEMGDFEKGLEKLEKIQNNPAAPKGLIFIINKLRFEAGRDYDAALAFIQFSLQNTKDPVLVNKLSADLYALKAQRDLECLNEGKTDCDMRDAEGHYYRKEGDTWKSQRPFNPYKIHLKKK